MYIPDSAFAEGKQPCQNFTPGKVDIANSGQSNRHECYAPFDGPRECGGQVSWCENCMHDHHSHGYETCCKGEAEKEQA
jgi:hypothetical protein